LIVGYISVIVVDIRSPREDYSMVRAVVGYVSDALPI